MLEKILKKDQNEELEKILAEKQVDEQAKNLLQGILYKIEVSYNDYQKVKGINQSVEQYIDELLINIKKKCNEIKVVKISQKLEDEKLEAELKKNKFYVSEKTIISYPIEEKLLYAIEKKSNNKKILNNKYEEATIAVSDLINNGKNINRVEVLKDFNGWSWTVINKEIENIDANLIYQMLQILYGMDFLEDWCKDKDGIIDYFDVMQIEGKKYGEQEIDNLKRILTKIAIVNDLKENKEFAKQVSQKIKAIDEELKRYEDTKTNIERISENKKIAVKQLKEIEKTLRQESMLKAEYEKRNMNAPIDKKIFNIKVLKKELEDSKKKLLNEINEYNYMLNPMNYMKEKKKIEDEKDRLDFKNITTKQKEKLKIEFVKCFLNCFNLKIEEAIEQEEILRLIYQFRYFMFLPFDMENNIKDIKQLKKDIVKTQKILVEKAIDKKVIIKVPFEVMQRIFETRIINLEELYYKIQKQEEKYYVQIFDENIKEEKFEINLMENIKINKKIKIFI